MDTNACFLPWHTWTTDFLRLTPVLGAALASEDTPTGLSSEEPIQPPEGMLPLTFWSGTRPIASRWFEYEAHGRLRASSFFAEATQVVFVGSLPVQHPGWLRVDPCAIGTNPQQVNELLAMFATPCGNVPLGDVGHGRVGLPLGHHWVPLPDDLTVLVRDGCEETRARIHDFATDAYGRILFGTDAQMAIRFLDSIPGRERAVC